MASHLKRDTELRLICSEIKRKIMPLFQPTAEIVAFGV